jgi:hypothetical protein
MGLWVGVTKFDIPTGTGLFILRNPHRELGFRDLAGRDNTAGETETREPDGFSHGVPGIEQTRENTPTVFWQTFCKRKTWVRRKHPAIFLV